MIARVETGGRVLEAVGGGEILAGEEGVETEELVGTGDTEREGDERGGTTSGTEDGTEGDATGDLIGSCISGTAESLGMEVSVLSALRVSSKKSFSPETEVSVITAFRFDFSFSVLLSVTPASSITGSETSSDSDVWITGLTASSGL